MRRNPLLWICFFLAIGLGWPIDIAGKAPEDDAVKVTARITTGQRTGAETRRFDTPALISLQSADGDFVSIAE